MTGDEPRPTRDRLPVAHDPVVIVGADINGGLFRDVSLQRIDSLLVEAGAACAGANAAPWRLIHGGSSDLESGDVAKLAHQRHGMPRLRLPEPAGPVRPRHKPSSIQV